MIPMMNAMSSPRTPTFICELPLRAGRREVRLAGIRLEVGRQLYNASLSEALQRLRRLRTSPAWARAGGLQTTTRDDRQRRARAFRRTRERHGFTDYALQKFSIATFRKARWMEDHLGTHEVQKVGTRAYRAANRILLGSARRVRFKGCAQFDSLEGKSNATGIRWRGDHVEWGALVLPAVCDPKDAFVAHALAQRIKYVRIVRRRVRGTIRLYAQLVCQGRPYWKPQHQIGEGEAAIDLGPSTVAAVGAESALLAVLCAPVVRQHGRIRVLQRRLDRQRRANNPENYLPDGRIKPGSTRWGISMHQGQVRDRVAELYRREKAHRQTLHGQLANQILRMGRLIRTETTSGKALQRTFGTSVSVRAPGMFLAMLRRKAERAGGQLLLIPVRVARLSQTCHGCGKIQKKLLRERVHQCACGITMQRDLYSAFLARHTDREGVLHANQARAAWSGAEPLLRVAWSKALQPAMERPRPFTFGRPSASRSQSGLPAEEGTANVDARDASILGETRGDSP